MDLNTSNELMTKIAIHNGLYVCGGLPRVA